MSKHAGRSVREKLLDMRSSVESLLERLNMQEVLDVSQWSTVIDSKLIPRLSEETPLIVAICGGGSSGKSTLFNSLIGQSVSPVGGSAGINRRVLVSGHEHHFSKTDNLASLFEPFGCAPEPLGQTIDLTTRGCPLYVTSKTIPPGLLLMDTPDFDTGSKGAYTNRDVARQALETADVLIYIFTNSNYNNRDNTDFISEMLTGIGRRKCFLVYRVYPSFTPSEIAEHAMKVATNLYGDEAEEYVLGIYRADEDNAIAARQRYMALKPIRDHSDGLIEDLIGIDVSVLRHELLSSLLVDVLGRAEEIITNADSSLEELLLYQNTLLSAQSRCVQEALQHFPMERVLKRFSEIWLDGDPFYIKAMRQTGTVVELPLKLVLRTAGWVHDMLGTQQETPSVNQLPHKIDEDLLNAISTIQAKVVSSEISATISIYDPAGKDMLDTLTKIRKAKGITGERNPRAVSLGRSGEYSLFITAHEAVFEQQELLRKRDWKATFESILMRRDIITNISEGIEEALNQLADEFRSSMGLWAKTRQTFSALLNVLPATAAVSYMFSTADIMGAAGIQVKLAGLFGLNDLYALVAIPATTGLKKADLKQLEYFLVPIAQTWLNNKLEVIQALFEKEISGEVLNATAKIIAESKMLISRIADDIRFCKKEVG